MELTQVLLKPLVTEKSTELRQDANRVVFLVHPAANKVEIKKAVEDAFGVDVLGVNVIRIQPRVRARQGRTVGMKPGYKKAVVTLAEGAKIEYFEGV